MVILKLPGSSGARYSVTLHIVTNDANIATSKDLLNSDEHTVGRSIFIPHHFTSHRSIRELLSRFGRNVSPHGLPKGNEPRDVGATTINCLERGDIRETRLVDPVSGIHEVVGGLYPIGVGHVKGK